MIDNPSDPQTPNDDLKEWRVPYVARSSDVDYGYLVVRARTAEEALALADGPDSPYSGDDIIWDEKPEVVDGSVELDIYREPFVIPHTERKSEEIE